MQTIHLVIHLVIELGDETGQQQSEWIGSQFPDLHSNFLILPRKFQLAFHSDWGNDRNVSSLDAGICIYT